MIDELLQIYDESRLNQGQPESLFNPTLIFNEGWLLRALMRHWKLAPGQTCLPFLPLPNDATLYSEGQLYTPFVPRWQGDPLGESHTHVDGIAGDFSISGTKSGIKVHSDCRYLAVFEAKMYSGLAGGISHAKGYDQVSRSVACMLNALLLAGCTGPYAAHFVVLYPADNKKIEPNKYGKGFLEQQIAMRVEGYGLQPESVFGRCWRATLETVQVHFVTWEAALAEASDDRLNEFYERCRRFNS